ncbi:MAG: hypothetical protein ACM31L_16175 [Actinomycetota bacterium]
MFITNIRIEAPSDTPSLAQAMIQTYAQACDVANTAWSLFSPYGAMVLIYRFNRQAAKAIGL